MFPSESGATQALEIAPSTGYRRRCGKIVCPLVELRESFCSVAKDGEIRLSFNAVRCRLRTELGCGIANLFQVASGKFSKKGIGGFRGLADKEIYGMGWRGRGVSPFPPRD